MKHETMVLINQICNGAEAKARGIVVETQSLQDGDLVMYKVEGQLPQAVKVNGNNKANVNFAQAELYYPLKAERVKKG